EIESALREHPAVADAAVVTRGLSSDPRSLRLCAFVEPFGGGRLPADGLRAHLRDRLPAAMIPRWFVRTTLPRGESGKVDLRALGALPIDADPLPREALHDFDAATILATLWTNATGSGPRDWARGFVDAGGDSLAALELAAAAESHGLAIVAEALLANAS